MYLKGFAQSYKSQAKIPIGRAHWVGFFPDMLKFNLVYREAELQSKQDKLDVVFA